MKEKDVYRKRGCVRKMMMRELLEGRDTRLYWQGVFCILGCM
jgi:hypothetical protein